MKAMCRKALVNKACQWYWKTLQGDWGQAHQIMVVGDHYGEVAYTENFCCSDKQNRYLDESTILILLKEANGELTRETKTGDKHHPTNSVKRIKRRRKYLKKLTKGIYQSNTGALYYAKTTVPQISKNGQILQKRKRENFKLASKDLKKAEAEVERRFGEPLLNRNDSPKSCD